MARRPRASSLQNRTTRLKLAVREKPHDYTSIGPGIAIGYRRLRRGAGRWVVRWADGHGGNKIKNIGTADDFEAADGEHILDFGMAIDKARRYARSGGTDTGSGKAATVKDAIDAYEKDLLARSADPFNARRLRRHMAPIANVVVGTLTAGELATWRSDLQKAGMKSATLVRTCRALKAALNLAARRDKKRVQNRGEWKDGLGGIKENYESRNMHVLDDAQIIALIAAAYEADSGFGRLVEVAAVTGARTSQITRLTVAPAAACARSRKRTTRRRPKSTRSSTASPTT